MLDEAALESMVRDAGDSIAVPGDGPERIIAARDSAVAVVTRPSALRRAASSIGRSARRPRTLATLGLAAALILAVSLAAAHHPGGGTKASSAVAGRGSSVSAAVGAGAAAAPASAAGSSGSSAGAGVAGSANGPDTQSGQSSASGSSLPSLPSRIVKTGTVVVQVPAGRLHAAVASMSTEADGLGGFVASTNTSSDAGGSTPSADLVLRVPVSSFETLLSFVQKEGTVTSVTTAGKDVTSQYVDLQARIQSLQDARTQYQQILARATSIGDILSVEQQLSALQTQLEQLQGQLNVLDDSATYSTLSVTVTEKAAAGAPPARRPPSGLARAWDHARSSFVHGVEAVIGASGGIAVFLLFAGAAVALARAGWILLRRRLV